MHLWVAGGPPTGSLYAYGWDLTHPWSQLGWLRSARDGLSSSSKLVPACLHGSWQGFKRERESMEGLPRAGLRSHTVSLPPQFISQSKLQESQDSRSGKVDSTVEVRSCKSSFLRGKHTWNIENCINETILLDGPRTQLHRRLEIEPTIPVLGGDLNPLPFN